MPDKTRDEYRPSAALSDQPWHLPSTLSRSLEREALVGSSLARTVVHDTSVAATPARRPTPTGQNVWSDITIAHDSDEVHGDELDDALDLVAAPPGRPPVPPAPFAQASGGTQPGGYGQPPSQTSLQGVSDTFQQLFSQAGAQPRPTNTRVRRKPARNARRPAEQSNGGRLVGTFVVLGIVVKLLLEVLRATGH